MTWRFRKAVTVLLVATYPLEWSKTLFPFLLLDRTVDGAAASVLDLFRIVALGVVAAWALLALERAARRVVSGRFSVDRCSVASAFAALVVWYGCSAVLVAGDPGGARTELVRTGFLVCLFLAVVQLLTTEDEVALVGTTLAGLGVIFATAAILQYVTGWYLWNPSLNVNNVNRVNLTFADPNILARFLAICFVYLLCLHRGIPGWRRIRLILVPISAAGLFTTLSRSGVLALIAGVLLLRHRRVVEFRWTTWLALAAGLLALMASSAMSDRVATMGDLAGAFGARVALIATAIGMFIDHPIVGIGVSSFRTVALRNYTDLLPYGGAYVTASHTSLATVMAEQGLIGLALCGILFWRMFRASQQAAASVQIHATAALVSIVVLVLSSQSEGALFEDPMLYLLAGVLVATTRLVPPRTDPAVAA